MHHTTVPAEHYTLARGADVFATLRDDDTWSSKYGPGLAYGEISTGISVGAIRRVTPRNDSRSHRVKPSVLEAMGPDIRALVNELVDEVVDAGRGDIVRDLAMPLPLVVMCWMLGMPQEDIAMFRSWVLPMAEAVRLEGGRAANDEVLNAYRQYYAYFGPHIQRRADALDAGEVVPADLLTRLLTIGAIAQKLTQQQVIGFCQFLLVAGSATTTLLIGNVVERLMRHADQMALVQTDRTLIPNAIEESLRIDAPVHGLFREQLPGHAPRRRDPRGLQGVHAVRLGQPRPGIVGRPRPLRRHLVISPTSASAMARSVPGSTTAWARPARLEGAVALEAVLDRMPRIRPDGDPVHVKASVLHGFESLPVRWD